MGEAFFLTKQDRDDLQSLLSAFRAGRLSVKGNGRLIDRVGQSPECYIAYPTTIDGIPGLQIPGTATSTADDETHPGEAECNLYQIVPDDYGNPVLEAIDSTVTVYNLSTETVAADWLTIVRDKFGSWIPAYQSLQTSFIKRGKLATSLATGSRISPLAGIIHIWDFDGTDWADSGEVLTVYDDGMIPQSSSPLPVGTWIQIVKINGYWFYDGHNCDAAVGTGS